MERFRFVIITGMSGAGKTNFMQKLEDMGYYCVDNLPPVLIARFADLCWKSTSNTRHVPPCGGGFRYPGRFFF